MIPGAGTGFLTPGLFIYDKIVVFYLFFSSKLVRRETKFYFLENSKQKILKFWATTFFPAKLNLCTLRISNGLSRTSVNNGTMSKVGAWFKASRHKLERWQAKHNRTSHINCCLSYTIHAVLQHVKTSPTNSRSHHNGAFYSYHCLEISQCLNAISACGSL